MKPCDEFRRKGNTTECIECGFGKFEHPASEPADEANDYGRDEPSPLYGEETEPAPASPETCDSDYCDGTNCKCGCHAGPAPSTPGDTLRQRILAMMEKREWSIHWTVRLAYLNLESSELAEAVRGKHGDTLKESADALITPRAWPTTRSSCAATG